MALNLQKFEQLCMCSGRFRYKILKILRIPRVFNYAAHEHKELTETRLGAEIIAALGWISATGDGYHCGAQLRVAAPNRQQTFPDVGCLKPIVGHTVIHWDTRRGINPDNGSWWAGKPETDTRIGDLY
jgi:hypothetical protein